MKSIFGLGMVIMPEVETKRLSDWNDFLLFLVSDNYFPVSKQIEDDAEGSRINIDVVDSVMCASDRRINKVASHDEHLAELTVGILLQG